MSHSSSLVSASGSDDGERIPLKDAEGGGGTRNGSHSGKARPNPKKLKACRRFGLWAATGRGQTVILIAGLGLAGAVLAVVLALSMHSDEPDAPLISTHGAVASDHPTCSQMGVDVMKASGGNAFDAAVTTALCLGLMNPQASGIGGGCFIVMRQNNGNVTFLDAREEAPAAATQDMFVGQEEKAQVGALAGGVPGELAGLFEMHARLGALPWSDVVTPVAEAAEAGFTVGPAMARSLAGKTKYIVGPDADPGMASVFSKDGVVLVEGDTCKRPGLAETLRRVAEEGVGVIYGGDIGAALAADVQAAGGIITAEDLGNYTAVERPVQDFWYQGMHFYGASPPSSGGIISALVLNLLEAYNLPAMGASKRSLAYHYLVESFKLAYARRMNLGCPPWAPANYSAVYPTKDYAAGIRHLISPDRTFPIEHYATRIWDPIDDHGTTHFSVVDAARNAVALTSTVNLGFGSRFLSPSTGILLNDEMDDFSSVNLTNAFGVPPSPANYIQPGKRPLSSMTPTIVTESDELVMVAGASGGTHIPTATLQVLLNVLAYGYNVAEAISLPRLHNQFLPNVVLAEDLFSNSIADYLRDLGNAVNRTDAIGVVQAIVVHKDESGDGSTYLASASDWRKDGAPAGY